MGITELLLILAASVPAVVVVAIGWRGGLFASSGARPPLAMRAVAIGAAATLLGVAAGLGVGLSVEPVAWLALPEGTELSVAHPAEPILARLRMGAVLAAGLASPRGGARGPPQAPHASSEDTAAGAPDASGGGA